MDEDPKKRDGLHLPPGVVWPRRPCELAAHQERAGDRPQSLFGLHVSLCYHRKQLGVLLEFLSLLGLFETVYMRAVLSAPLDSESFPAWTCTY